MNKEEEGKVGASHDAGTALQTSTIGKVTDTAEYGAMIGKVRDAFVDGQNHALDMYWIMGEAIQAHIAEQDSRNVSAALKKITQDVGAVSYGLSDLKADTLRNALKVREKLTKVQLELAKAGGVSLRNLMPMCKNDVTSEERDVILQDVTDGKLVQTEIKNKLLELHPPAEKQEKRGGARKKEEDPLVFMKRVQEEMDALLKDMKESYRVHAATALGSEDQATKDEYTQLFEANADKIELLNRQWLANKKVTQALLDE